MPTKIALLAIRGVSRCCRVWPLVGQLRAVVLHLWDTQFSRLTIRTFWAIIGGT
jgi:hypothetical protein